MDDFQKGEFCVGKTDKKFAGKMSRIREHTHMQRGARDSRPHQTIINMEIFTWDTSSFHPVHLFGRLDKFITMRFEIGTLRSIDAVGLASREHPLRPTQLSI